MPINEQETELSSSERHLRSWFSFVRIFSFREKVIIWCLLVIMFGALGYWTYALYRHFTQEIPTYGGTYTEGMVGQPAYINPVLSGASETDSDIVSLIYSGLLKLDDQGNVQPSIAESWEVSEDNKTYTVHLKKDVLWHDGHPVEAHDALFTYQTIQDPAYKSPLRQNWQGVDIRQIDDFTVTFTLSSPYFGFLNNLTVGLLPRHIWENISPERFALANTNLEPIGCGPFRYVKTQKDSAGNVLEYDMEFFPKFFGKKPYINKVNMLFYPSEDEVIEAYVRKEIMGIHSMSPERIRDIAPYGENFNTHVFSVPHYFLVFFNQTKSVALSYDEVRTALSLAVDRKAIVENVLHGFAVPVSMSFLPGMSGYVDIESQLPDLERAKKILDDNGWVVQDDGIRSKNGVKLEFDMMTADWPEFSRIADVLSEQWKLVGAQANIKVVSVYDLGQNYIRPREYAALFFAQATGINPDIYAYWHSSQKKDPGLNLSLFSDKDADSILERSREVLGNEERGVLYRQFQDIFMKKSPALYVVSPEYIYPVDKKVQGIQLGRIENPSGRFSHIEDWYIKTKRIWRQ